MWTVEQACLVVSEGSVNTWPLKAKFLNLENNIMDTLAAFSLKIAKVCRSKLFHIIGKHGRIVPVLLTKKMSTLIALLLNCRRRLPKSLERTEGYMQKAWGADPTTGLDN